LEGNLPLKPGKYVIRALCGADSLRMKVNNAKINTLFIIELLLLAMLIKFASCRAYIYEKQKA